MAGLTSAGFDRKFLSDIIDEIVEELRSEIDPGILTDPDDPLGQAVGVFSNQLADVWSLGQAMYSAFNPETAEGTVLDALCLLVGITRQDEEASTGTITCTGTNGTVIEEESIVKVQGGERFVVTADTTIADSTEVPVRAENTGPITLEGAVELQIVTPITGWDTAELLAGQEVSGGNDVETDAELRERRRLSLGLISGATDNSIRAAILAVENVQQAVVISDRDEHTFRAYVYPDTVDGQTLALAIYNVMPAGIRPLGDEEYNITDSMDYSQVVRFDYVTELSTDVSIEIVTDTGDYAGDEALEAAIQEYFDDLIIGQDVSYDEIRGIVATFDGVDSITTCEVPDTQPVENTLGSTKLVGVGELATAGTISVTS